MSSTTSVSSGYDFLLRGRPSRKSTSTPPHDFLAQSDENSLDMPTPGMVLTPPHHAAERPRSPPTPTVLEPVHNAQAVQASEHGRYLGEKLDFLTPPHEIEYPDFDVNGRARTLFVGQLRFETTANELRYLVQQLTGVRTLKADVRGAGCYVLYVANEMDEALVRALNRRLLFDHNGVWFARTPDATELLLDYVEKVLPGLKGSRRRTLRLPRDCIVIEDSRTKKNPQSMRSSPNVVASRSPYTSYSQSSPHHHAHPQQMMPAQLQHREQSYYSASNGTSYGYSEPTTPYGAHSPSGFHGTSLPDYVYSEAMPPPPPYSAATAWH